MEWRSLGFSIKGPAGSTGATGPAGDRYKADFSYDFKTPNENDGLMLQHDNLKGLAYSPYQSVLIATGVVDYLNPIYGGGDAGPRSIAGGTSDAYDLLYGGGADIPTRFKGGLSGFSTLYSGGTSMIGISNITYYGGNYNSSDYYAILNGSGDLNSVLYGGEAFFGTYPGGTTDWDLYNGGDSISVITDSLYGGTSEIVTYYYGGDAIFYPNSTKVYGGNSDVFMTYYGGDSLESLNTILYGGTAQLQLIYFGGKSTSVNSTTIIGGGTSELMTVYYGGNSSSENSLRIIYGGSTQKTRNTTQSYRFSSGSSSSSNDKVYSAGNSVQVFGQRVTGGRINSNYTNLETKLEGIIDKYNKQTGELSLEKLTNINGLFGNTVDYVVNLSGERGTSISSNYGPPIPKIGRTGDVYIDKLTRDFYNKQYSWNLL